MWNNKNTSYNDHNDDNVRFLMTKTMMIVIADELVTIVIVTVIMITYKRNSMEKKTERANLT